MSYAFRAAADRYSDLNLADLINAARKGDIGADRPLGRRARRSAKSQVADAGVIAALLGIQGCMTLGGGNPSVTSPDTPGGDTPGDTGGSGSSGSTSDDYPVHENVTTEIQASELLKDYSDAQSIKAIVSVENGTAMLHGTVVHFTPAEGFSGAAKITFTYLDSSGKAHRGEFEIFVDDDAATAHEHGSDGSGDHAGHDGGSMPGMDHSDMDMSNDPEHMAIMALVQTSDATHVAVKSGSWFDPSTWANGQVPGDGAKVVIPDGVTVAYDGESSASILTVRVDGELDFATDRDTFLEVDTMVVTATGRLTIGTEGNPVAANVEAVIQIADNGPIDVSWDPQLLSRGVISMGSVEISGAEKETFIKLAVDAMAGDKSMLLESAPDGWKVGDKVVLTGTHLGDDGTAAEGEARDDATTQDEVLVITKIVGNRVYFDHALQYNHDGARDDLMGYAANYTRNVRIQTEGGEATPVSERGHLMMHSDDVDIRYAEFYELGRTDKSERAFDAADVNNITSDTNVKGRYALHLHHTGVSDIDDPAILYGNSVWGSPGWGFVQHDSNAILEDNAAYNVFGAAFVAETGNETGRWAHNIAIKSLGMNVSPKDGADFDAFDQARGGIGFWWEGRMVEAVDNVAAGMPGGHGFVYMSRIPLAEEIMVDPDGVSQGAKLRYLDGNYINEPNIAIFSGNEAIAAYHGLEVIKNGPQQNNDSRTVLEDFTAWEVARGVILQYTGHYTLTGLDLVATDNPGFDQIKLIGLWYQTNVFDVVVNDADISGFQRGVLLKHESLLDGITDFRYFFVDVNITGADTNYSGLLSQDKVLSGSALHDVTVSYHSSLGDIISGPDVPSDAPLILYGTKTDSLGTTETSTDWDPFVITYWSIRGAVEQNGYWKTSDGRLITLVEEYASDRATGHLEKFGLWVEVPSGMPLTPGVKYEGVRVTPEYHGIYDPDNAAPVAHNDTAHVGAGDSVVINVLANDMDPEGDDIDLSDIWSQHGRVVANDDGTVTYFADTHATGNEVFYYWVEDDQGNFTKAQVTVTIDA